MSFMPRAWPPGLACSPGSHRWEHYPYSPNGTPEWALDLDSLIRSMKLSKSNDRRIRAAVFTALRRAERGELTVVVKNLWSGNKSGEVDQMSLSQGKILEIRLEEIEGRELLKGKRLRLYFAEPATRDILLGLVFAPKDVPDGQWKEQQNRAVLKAEFLADEWWDWR